MKQIFYLEQFTIILILIGYFSYNEFKNRQKIRISNLFNSIIIDYSENNKDLTTDSLIKIKKLDIWSSELEEVSLIKEMPNIEICSLSLNKITTLIDFKTS